MKHVKLVSPCGTSEIVCNPARVEQMKEAGWVEKTKKAKATKPSKEDK